MELQFTEDDKQMILEQALMDVIDLVIRIDPVTGKAATLFSKSESWKKTMGVEYDFEETMRSYLNNCSADSNTEKLLASISLTYIKGHMRRKHRYNTFFSIRNDKGDLRVKKAYLFPKQDGQIMFIIRDITDDLRGAADNVEDLEYAYKMTNRELDKRNAFLNLMSRNIRDPLQSIMGLTKIARDSDDTSSIDAYLHKISMSGTYMSETIDDILDLRRIANREIVLNPSPIKLSEFFVGIRHMIEPVCEDRELLFSMKADVAPDLTVNADFHALQQIVMKLLQSMMNYTVKGGRIHLTVREVVRKEDTVSIEVSVECLGIVIDQERMKMLFQPYDYLLDKMNEDIGSLDIAFVILKSYVTAMGTDTLMVESHESRGTKVSLTLSMDLANESGQKDEMNQLLPMLAGKRVLIVDDNEINLEIGEKILTLNDMEVVTASNGKEAVNLYVKEYGRFDFILMDILMPVMDGLEATRQIRAIKEIKGSDTIPIIAMTANALNENFEESFRSGMDEHLVKPISPEKLLGTMAKVLADRESADK